MANGPTLIGSVQRALHLLDAVGTADRPVLAKSLARSLGLALPTTYHLLRTLVHEGYLRKLDDGYVLGERVTALQQGGAQAVIAHLRPELQTLRERVQAAAYLAVLRDGEITVVDIVDAPETPRADLWVGERDAGHATAFGKCVLSQMHRDDREDYLSRHPLADLTPHTITDPRRLAERLGPERPWFDDREEYRLGTACLAAPVIAPGVLGAVAISVSAGRFGAAVADSTQVVGAARRASLLLAASD